MLFDDLDADASGELEWNEFKAALRQLGIRLPVHKMREVVSPSSAQPASRAPCM